MQGRRFVAIAKLCRIIEESLSLDCTPRLALCAAMDAVLRGSAALCQAVCDGERRRSEAITGDLRRSGALDATLTALSTEERRSQQPKHDCQIIRLL